MLICMLLFFFISSKMKITIKNMHQNNQDNNKQIIQKNIYYVLCEDKQRVVLSNTIERNTISLNIMGANFAYIVMRICLASSTNVSRR